MIWRRRCTMSQLRGDRKCVCVPTRVTCPHVEQNTVCSQPGQWAGRCKIMTNWKSLKWNLMSTFKCMQVLWSRSPSFSNILTGNEMIKPSRAHPLITRCGPGQVHLDLSSCWSDTIKNRKSENNDQQTPSSGPDFDNTQSLATVQMWVSGRGHSSGGDTSLTQSPVHIYNVITWGPAVSLSLVNY